MSTANTPDPQRSTIAALITAVTILGVIAVLGTCGFAMYLAWRHPGAAAPLGIGATLLGSIGTIAAVALFRRR
ncbi:hypothetical protein [Streptomyces kanasensis]|uniref:Uncharacterized protein n=1 Tax=Streptomyces kanasensis TaxID=936756 RepID=A0A100Y165_9ACTN|nr:hypothetical protein [Streptomyces kanasensis]KUH35792.1 hypothetical protein ATE80_27125 [Streptomyces kanasensis]